MEVVTIGEWFIALFSAGDHSTYRRPGHFPPQLHWGEGTTAKKFSISVVHKAFHSAKPDSDPVQSL